MKLNGGRERTAMRLLVVDDDSALRALVRATFDDVSVEVAEAESAAAARAEIARDRPDVIVLDVVMPRESGLELCRELKASPDTAGIPVVLLSGSGDVAGRSSFDAGADAYLPKPFSPLQLLGLVERLAQGEDTIPLTGHAPAKADDPQLLLYARDLRRLFELERAQRRLVQEAYRETVGALADALATKDTPTRAHSQRVQKYAVELAHVVDPVLAEDPSIEYGFLLHDVGKIGVPDDILGKRGPLTPDERGLMEQHTVLGEQMLRGVAFLRGEGIAVVRSHHERWDGGGYPDGLSGTDIPIAARIFAVADALDAMTSDRPYRKAGSWAAAAREIDAQAGRQFDPAIVRSFTRCDVRLRRARRDLAAA
jgi:response regulator RpfG family c-di-GMP phosphodiesterase